VSARPIRLVLDTSAIAAYATTVDVGETINEVHDNNSAFAMPVACLVEAAQLVPADLLELLIDNDTAVIVSLDAGQWRTLAAMRRLLGRLDITAAFAAAEAHACDILTAEPELYSALGDDPPVIPID
jgi:hypothetical protein